MAIAIALAIAIVIRRGRDVGGDARLSAVAVC